MDLKEKIEKALEVAMWDGQTDGCHHKEWVIDQMVRALVGDNYEKLIQGFCNGEDGPDTYTWSVGIPP